MFVSLAPVREARCMEALSTDPAMAVKGFWEAEQWMKSISVSFSYPVPATPVTVPPKYSGTKSNMNFVTGW